MVEHSHPDAVKHGILEFLRQNPEACDVVEGIALFWVPHARKTALEEALSALVADGVLRQVEIGHRTHYCLACRGL